MLIIQDNRYEATNSATALPSTTAEVDARLLRVPVTAMHATGLDRPSFVMIDTLSTVQ